jgi:hypothetical protein
MYVIKIFCDFCISEKCKENYEKIYRTFEMELYGPNKKVYFTNEDVYTHAIIINQTMPPNLMIPKKNVIGLAFEPRELMNFHPEFIEYAKKNIGKYYIGTKSGLQDPFVEGFGYMWFADPGRNISFVEKPKIMSIILSEKKFAHGHKYRHQLVDFKETETGEVHLRFQVDGKITNAKADLLVGADGAPGGHRQFPGFESPGLRR